jgi:hypothetical protein
MKQHKTNTSLLVLLAILQHYNVQTTLNQTNQREFVSRILKQNLCSSLPYRGLTPKFGLDLARSYNTTKWTTIFAINYGTAAVIFI